MQMPVYQANDLICAEIVPTSCETIMIAIRLLSTLSFLVKIILKVGINKITGFIQKQKLDRRLQPCREIPLEAGRRRVRSVKSLLAGKP